MLTPVIQLMYYLDFQKAFDKVAHKHLLFQINAHGISVILLHGLQIGYLIENKECV